MESFSGDVSRSERVSGLVRKKAAEVSGGHFRSSGIALGEVWETILNRKSMPLRPSPLQDRRFRV